MSVETDLNSITGKFPPELVEMILSKIDYNTLKEIRDTTENDIIRQISDEIFTKVGKYIEIVRDDPTDENFNKLLKHLELDMVKIVLSQINIDTLKYINSVSKNSKIIKLTDSLILKMNAYKNLYSKMRPYDPNTVKILVKMPITLIEWYFTELADQDFDDSEEIDEEFPPTHHVSDLKKRVRDPKLIQIIDEIIEKNKIIYSSIDGYNVYKLRVLEQYSHPTFKFLESQYQHMISLGASHEKSLLDIVYYITKNTGFLNGEDVNQDCFKFLDSHNFNYNSKGHFTDHIKCSYLIQYACYVGNFELLVNLHKRGASLHNDIYSIDLNLIVLSLMYNIDRHDVSEIINYLTQHGILITRQSYERYAADINPNLHPNTTKILKKLKLID